MSAIALWAVVAVDAEFRRYIVFIERAVGPHTTNGTVTVCHCGFRVELTPWSLWSQRQDLAGTRTPQWRATASDPTGRNLFLAARGA